MPAPVTPVSPARPPANLAAELCEVCPAQRTELGGALLRS
jgi:hypothetical protein